MSVEVMVVFWPGMCGREGEMLVCLSVKCLCRCVAVDKLRGQTTASPSALAPGVASLADMLRQKDAFVLDEQF